MTTRWNLYCLEGNHYLDEARSHRRFNTWGPFSSRKETEEFLAQRKTNGLAWARGRQKEITLEVFSDGAVKHFAKG
jgi:hypothetical protein